MDVKELSQISGLPEAHWYYAAKFDLLAATVKPSGRGESSMWALVPASLPGFCSNAPTAGRPPASIRRMRRTTTKR